jgi:hypothetical protein
MKENSKLQVPNPKQIPKFKIQYTADTFCRYSDCPNTRCNLKFKAWSLFEMWSLGFEIFSLHT